MASIFTFEPDPPRVASPWITSAKQSPGLTPRTPSSQSDLLEDFEGLVLTAPDDVNVTGLGAEPQEGPTEYKLHLLLRSRRQYNSSSTSKRVAGSQHFKTPGSAPRSVSEGLLHSASRNSQSTSSRQHRLEQLTTQLLWRLKQSSPHHASSASSLVLPSLPEVTHELRPPETLSPLMPGLEESRGALYEIGVSDDGTFVGLTRDEMMESLSNLRAMAASLGCSVDVLRMVRVGECDWFEHTQDGAQAPATLLRARLYVAEAYVKPELAHRTASAASRAPAAAGELPADVEARSSAVENEQLRVSFTGATNAGKSSLLGTLLTSTLDNGRGKSRLSLLKHRHELASGLTSSVSHELLGYKDDGEARTTVVNYADDRVSTWIDIHNLSNPGRLLLVTDPPGHPRYRRTTVRGLVSWAPHWTLMCVSATDELGARGHAAREDDVTSFSGSGSDLSMAHLDLCLRLRLRLVVLVTKFDAATKTGIREVLSAILTSLKSAGRVPLLLPNDTKQAAEAELQHLSQSDVLASRALAQRLGESDMTVPIIFVSAVKGNGIGKLHSILQTLPIPDATGDGPASDSRASPLFHVDDTFRLHAADSDETNGVIVSGHLARGTITVGDELMIGPFSSSPSYGNEEKEAVPPSHADDPFLTPRSFGDALAARLAASNHHHHQHSRPVYAEGDEWRRVIVASIRNLRLPVRTLQQDQAGTIALTAVAPAHTTSQALLIRKGVVLTDRAPRAAHSLTASFDIDDAASVVVGSLVVVYFASVRASAKVLAVSLQNPSDGEPDAAADDDDEAFGFDFEGDSEANLARARSAESILVSFQFLASREYVEVGTMVFVMPSGGGRMTARGVGGAGGGSGGGSGGGRGGGAGAGGAGDVGSLDGFTGVVQDVFA